MLPHISYISLNHSVCFWRDRFVLLLLFFFPVEAEAKTDDIPLNIAFREGYTVSLPCPAYGFPRVKRIWFKEEQIIDVKQSRITVSTDGSLVIEQVGGNDEGRYICSVSNNVRGINYTDTATVHVTGE